MSDEETPQQPASPLGEIRDMFKHLAQPVIDNIDGRLRGQIDTRVDERVTELLTDRLSVLERALADVDRTVRKLQGRLDLLDSISHTPPE